MSMKVNWSPRLEDLADGLLEQWAELSRQQASPFGKICIVVNDKASENWLKQYALLVKKMPRVMMNVDFVMLSEIINDWLEAQVHGVSPRERKASLHPYSKDVLTWRIYRILSDAKEGGELDTLLAYLKKDEKNIAKRRYALSVKLARMYDDYLNSRFQMLNNWEQQIVEGDVPAWQPALYRMLAQEKDFGNTYAQDYAKAFQPGADAHDALGCGFPKYMAIHVFDTPFMSEPALHILEKMSEAMPITFWLFNPMYDWLADTPSAKEVKKELRRQLCKQLQATRSQLQAGNIPGEINEDFTEEYYKEEDVRLLGAMASGARAVLGTLLEDNHGDVNPLDENDNDPLMFADLKAGESPRIAVHRCYSPRRELEAIRDGLHDFFTTHKDAKPHDAIVLCGDWETYAPVIETVFNSDRGKAGYIPCIVDKGSSVETPLTQSFKDLLTFGDNRFEVSAVFNLLSVPAIQSKLGLDGKTMEDLREMVSKANIHWGADDQDVARILGVNESNANTFTWQRGMDRMVAEMLYGFPENADMLIKVGGTQLHPVGYVEAERATALASLWQFIQDLKALKSQLSGEKKLDELKKLLNDILDRFYSDEKEYLYELAIIRNAINRVSGSLEAAEMKNESLDTKVFITAVLDIMSSTAPRMKTPADAVLIAPLKSSYATPHKYVWICGMSEGTFPHNERRISFDIIGRHPSCFDAGSKERDAFALLKAAQGAREQLRLSFVGIDVHSNEKLPSSVLLNDLLDYFKATGMAFTEYSHPLHTYSRAYFQQGNNLPDTYDKESQEIAKLLQDAEKDKSKPEQLSGIAAFKLNDKGVTEIQLEDLEEFFCDSRRYVFEHCLGIKSTYLNDYDDDEKLDDVKLSKSHEELLALNKLDKDQQRHLAEVAVETGEASDEEKAMPDIETLDKSYDDRVFRFGEEDVVLRWAYTQFLGEPINDAAIELPVLGDRIVRIKMKIRVVEIYGTKFSFIFNRNYDDKKKDDTKNMCNAKNGVTVRHLAFNAVAGGQVVTVPFGLGKTKTLLPIKSFDDIPDATLFLKSWLAKLVELALKPLPCKILDYAQFAANAPYEYEEMEKLFKGTGILEEHVGKYMDQREQR